MEDKYNTVGIESRTMREEQAEMKGRSGEMTDTVVTTKRGRSAKMLDHHREVNKEAFVTRQARVISISLGRPEEKEQEVVVVPDDVESKDNGGTSRFRCLGIKVLETKGGDHAAIHRIRIWGRE